MLGSIDRCNRHCKGLAGAILLLQLAAATWVPVVHPYIHPDPPPPLAANEFADQSENRARGSGVESSCFICTAGPSFSAAGDQRLPFDVGIPWRLPLNTTVYLTTPHTDTPANSARGPPTSY